MQSAPLLSIDELRVAFLKRGLLGALAFLAAEQKYNDLSRGFDLPYDVYIKAYTQKEGC